MTDRKLTCVACKSAITKGDIAGSDLEFGGELKATNQPAYAPDNDEDLVATIKTLDGYTPMVRNSGTQTIAGVKEFTSSLTHKTSITPGATSPTTYQSSRDNIRITGSDNVVITGIGFEKGTYDSSRMVIRVNANVNTETNRAPCAEFHFILNENTGSIVLQPAHVDKDGNRTFGTAQTLMSWTP